MRSEKKFPFHEVVSVGLAAVGLLFVVIGLYGASQNFSGGAFAVVESQLGIASIAGGFLEIDASGILIILFAIDRNTRVMRSHTCQSRCTTFRDLSTIDSPTT